MHNFVYLAGIGGLGTPELLIIAVIVLLLFGSRKLPELAHSMGSSIQAFKKGMKDGATEKPEAPDAKQDEQKSH